MVTTLSNRGRHDNKSVAITAAELYHAQSECAHTECALGKNSTLLANFEVEGGAQL